MKQTRRLAGPKGCPGFALVETVVAVSLMGILGVGVLAGVAVAVKSTHEVERRLQAQYLARQQMESLKAAPFSVGGYQPQVSPPPGVTVEVDVQAVAGADSNVQQVQVTVRDQRGVSSSLTGFKLNR